MSRMHSGAKGVSGSKKPFKKTVKTWIRYKPKEVELLVGKMAKEGKSPSQIGLYLRDTYGIPDIKTLTGKKISAILDEKKLLHDVPEDLRSLIKKAAMIRRHLEENKLDETAELGLKITESKIKRLMKYYKLAGKLPIEWKYTPSKSSSYVE